MEFNQPELLATLAQRGLACYAATNTGAETLLNDLQALGNQLGRCVKGRGPTFGEIIKPQRLHEAHPRSLSSQYGLAALPLHAELSHRPRPCRYLLLGCMNPGSPGTATRLLDWRTLAFSTDELELLAHAPVFVRTGRRSFYATILAPDYTFLRYDPGCLEAVDKRGQSALDLLERRLALASPEAHEWHQGDILIIDNWRILHGRASSRANSGRCLARILIDA